MATFSRREVLRLAASLGLIPVAGAISACGGSSAVEIPTYDFEGEPGPETLFSHAVASGDPLSDAVILWTRVSTEGDEPVSVFWEMARDIDFHDRVAAGWEGTDSSLDYTVKVDVQGLDAGATYYYRFQALGRTSPAGRTKTAPTGSRERMRLGVVSCSSYNSGYFHAYRSLAERDDLDVVVHLGDYIYEYAGGGERAHLPDHEIVTLDDYRQRYAQYHTDPDLQAAHRQHAWILVWDDHESANDSWKDGASNHQEREGDWEDRKAAAAQAYSEWLPIRDQEDGRIFRSFHFGDLLDLTMLDTRIWGRDEPAGSASETAVIRDQKRTLLGFDQEEWLSGEMHNSKARWFALGQQVVMHHWKLQGLPEAEGGGAIANIDQWDGYHATRERLFDAVEDAGLDNLIVLAGDVHSSWASDLTRDPNEPSHYDPETGGGSLGVEMVCTSVTSTFGVVGLENILLALNPALKYGETTLRGYLLLDLDHERAQGEWYHFDDVSEVEQTEHLGAIWKTRASANHLEEGHTPAPPATLGGTGLTDI
ncbi:MAG: alkaline phosphatase D family protein [bacterium]